MAIGGRKPIPAHIRLLKNDTAHRHLYKDELPVKVGEMIAPDHLSEHGVEIFNKMVAQLEDLGINSTAHVPMLAIYATNMELVKYCQKFLSENGLTYESDTKTGCVIKPRPEVHMLQDAENRCLKILEQFGLSPSASVRVKIKPPAKAKNAFADLDKAM